MAKIKNETLLLLKNAVEISSTLGVETMVMDGISLRGENKELGVAIIMPTKDIDLEFDAIGIGRIPLLKSRMQMLDAADVTFDIFKRDTDELFVSNIQFKQGRTKLSFKCADPKMISAPKVINDPIFWEMQLNDADVQTLIKGIGTMSSEVVNFTSEDQKMTVKISDTEGDMFAHELEGEVTIVDDSAPSLCKSYKAKTLRTIFTNYIRKDENSILPISVTRRGVMRISVLNMFIYVFPER